MDEVKSLNLHNQNIVNQFVDYYNFIYSSDTGPAKQKYYRLHAIKTAITVVSKFKNPILKGEDLENVKGIGDKTIKRIDEIIQTGILSEISYKKNKLNTVKELTSIYGIGPSKANDLIDNYGITSIEQLQKAFNKNKIVLSEQIQLGLYYHNKILSPIPRYLIDNLSLKIETLFDKKYFVKICGSYRREKQFSNDIDILVSHANLNNDSKLMKKYLHNVVDTLKTFFIIADLTTNYTSHFMGYGNIKWNVVGDNKILDSNNKILDDDNDKNVVRVDIIIVPYESLPTALLHFTGSADFNQKIRLYAKKLGYMLNEYGLFKGKKRIMVDSEKDVFDKLNLKYIPPNER